MAVRSGGDIIGDSFLCCATVVQKWNGMGRRKVFRHVRFVWRNIPRFSRISFGGPVMRNIFFGPEAAEPVLKRKGRSFCAVHGGRSFMCYALPYC